MNYCLLLYFIKSTIIKYNPDGITMYINGLFLKAASKFSLKIFIKALVNPHPIQFRLKQVFQIQGIQISILANTNRVIEMKKYNSNKLIKRLFTRYLKNSFEFLYIFF
jgi:hypothetical protein